MMTLTEVEKRASGALAGRCAKVFEIFDKNIHRAKNDNQKPQTYF